MSSSVCQTLPRVLLQRSKHLPTPISSRSLFGLPSFTSSSKPSTPPKGLLRKVGTKWVYTESKVMHYTPKQLYAVIADVDSYTSFLPFATSSKVLSASTVSLKGKEKCSIAEKGWLTEAGEGEAWQLEAELRIGAMGYDEGYVSIVDARKFKSVSATAKDSTIFKHLHTQWKLTPLPIAPATPNIPNTQVDLFLSYQFASPFHAAAVSTMWEKISGLMIKGFEKRVEEVYGSRK